MSNPKQLWETYKVTNKLRIRPSDYLFIQDELSAWSIDRVVALFGMEVEADLEAIDDKNPKRQAQKRQARLEKWLGTAPKFRDPAVGRR